MAKFADPIITSHTRFCYWVDELKKGYLASGFVGGVSRLPADDIVVDMLSDLRADEQIEALRNWTDLPGKSILEVGSGCGALLVRGAVSHNLDIRGIEPSLGEFSSNLFVCRDMLAKFGLPAEIVTDATGESIPFPDNSFDIVHSSNVLEHVSDPQKTLMEAFRVLKPGGLLHIVVPNYGSWWEGHYGILWLPHIPRGLAKLYVRLLGRDPAYIDTLNLISHRQMAAWLQPLAARLDVLDWGWSLFEHRARTMNFAAWASLGFAHKVLSLLHRLRVIKVVLTIGRLLHWETPVVLVARKKAE